MSNFLFSRIPWLMDYDIIELSNLFKVSACGRHICPQKFKDNIISEGMVLGQEETQLLAAHTCQKANMLSPAEAQPQVVLMQTRL